MATTKSKFEGWSFSFQENTVTAPARRGRRGVADSSRLILKRDIDGFEIKSGDTLVTTDPSDNSRVVVLITEAKIGTADYITLGGLGFLRASEVLNPPEGSSPQELFLTSVILEVFVDKVVEHANVLNMQDFEKIAIDLSNEGNTFVCQRGYDTYYETYSEIFNIDDIKKGIYTDADTEIQALKDLILKPPFKAKKHTTADSKPKLLAPAPAKIKDEPIRRRSTKMREVSTEPSDTSDVSDNDSEGSEGSHDSDDSSSSSESESNLFDDDDDEFRPRYAPQVIKRGRGRPRGSTNKTKRGKKAIEAKKATNVKKEPIRKYNKRQKGPKSLILGMEKEARSELELASKTLPCRDEEFQRLYQTIESSVLGENGVCIYVSGTPGTGKTVTVREVIRQLYKRSKSDRSYRFDYLEINGLKLLTPQSAYELLWNKISDTKVPTASLQREIESYFQNNKGERPLVVLLDELDQVASKSATVLYNFFNWPTIEHSKLIVVAIANTMDLPERTLVNKTSSRLGLHRLQFPGYTHQELVEIIKSKFEILLREGVELKEDAIQFASRKIASVSGDARRALKICQRATELAVKHAEDVAAEEGVPVKYPIVVQAVYINRAILETTSSPIAQFITDLSFIAKLVLIGILSKKRKSGIAENSLGDVIDEIKQIVSVNTPPQDSRFMVVGKSILDILYEDFIIRPRGFEYVLNELIESGLVLQQNKNSDRNSVIKLNVADEEIISVFKTDKGLRYFMELTASEN